MCFLLKLFSRKIMCGLPNCERLLLNSEIMCNYGRLDEPLRENMELSVKKKKRKYGIILAFKQIIYF